MEIPQKVKDWYKVSRLPVRVRRRFAEGFVRLPLGVLGMAAAGGALCSETQTLPGYLNGAAQGVYNIPLKIIDTLHGVEAVAEAAKEISKDAIPLKNDLLELQEVVKSAEPVYEKGKGVYEKGEQVFNEAEKIIQEGKQLAERLAVEPTNTLEEIAIRTIERIFNGNYRNPEDTIIETEKAVRETVHEIESIVEEGYEVAEIGKLALEKVHTSGSKMTETMDKHETVLGNFADNKVSELTELVKNAADNLENDTAMAVTIAGFIAAAGVLGGHYLAKYVVEKIPGLNKIAGEERTTPVEDAIFAGKYVMQQTMAIYALVGISYSLGEESLYSKWLETEVKLRTHTEKITESATTLKEGLVSAMDEIEKVGESISPYILDTAGRTFDSLMHSSIGSSQPSEIEKEGPIEAMKGITQKYSDMFTQEGEIIYNNALSLKTEGEQFAEVMTEKQTTGEMYDTFLARVPEGIEQFRETPLTQIAENPNLQHDAAVYVMNTATNCAEHAVAAGLMGLTVVGIVLATTNIYAIGANSLHDFMYKKKNLVEEE